MRITWKRLGWIVAAAIPLAMVVGVVWLSRLDLSRYQARLAEQVRKVSGRELAAKVPLSVQLGREPAMVAEGVTFSNAPWASRPELARVRKLTLYLDPVSLLLGEVRIGRLVLEGADIQVEENEIGDTNLEMLPPVDGSGPHAGVNRSFRLRTHPTFPWIGTVEVRDSVLTIAGSAGRPAVVVEVPSATFQASAPNQPLQVEGRFNVPKGAPLALTGTAGSFEGWMRSLPGNLDLQGGFGGGKIAIKGSVGVKGTALHVEAEGPDLSVLGPYLQLPVPAGGPFTIAAKTATLRNTLKVEVTSLKVGSSEGTGEAVFRTSRKGTLTATVNADISRLDLRDLRAVPAAAAEEPEARRSVVPNLPFAARWLGRSTLSVNAQLGEVQGLASRMQNATVTLSSSETRFALRASATIGGGSAAVDIGYDPAGRAGQASLTASASHVPIGDLGDLLGFDWGMRDGDADIELRLRGGGRSARDALNVASGSLDVAIGRGAWPRLQLTSWPAESQRLLAAVEPQAFNCLAGHFEVSRGVASLRRLVIDTPRAALIGGGYVQLRSEAWEFLLAPEARDHHNAALALPLRLKGTGGRISASSTDAAAARPIAAGGPGASIVAQLNQAARQNAANPCVTVAARLDALRPGLRAQSPAPPTDQRHRAARPQSRTPAPSHRRHR